MIPQHQQQRKKNYGPPQITLKSVADKIDDMDIEAIANASVYKEDLADHSKLIKLVEIPFDSNNKPATEAFYQAEYDQKVNVYHLRRFRVCKFLTFCRHMKSIS